MNDQDNYLMNAPEITEDEIKAALQRAVRQTESCLKPLSGQFKHSVSQHNFYGPAPDNQWTNGFWTGELWLAYENTGNDVFCREAVRQVHSLMERIQGGLGTDIQDLGFLYSPSCVAGYKLTGNYEARKAALLAADELASCFMEKGQFIQTCKLPEGEENYRLIIDCLLNLPLLYWASQETKDPLYAALAEMHLETALGVLIRPDYSIYHTYYFDRKTGYPLYGATCQGYSADSAWSRGQAWGIYGIAISYRYTGKQSYLDLFERVTDYFLAHLPEDLVPYWDFTFTDGSDEPRDSSALAIAVCGLLEMSGCLPEGERQTRCRRMAGQLMKALVDECAAKSPGESNGQLLHGVYGRKTPYNGSVDHGIDECNLWGDYYYVEALTRLSREWNPYW